MFARAPLSHWRLERVPEQLIVQIVQSVYQGVFRIADRTWRRHDFVAGS